MRTTAALSRPALAIVGAGTALVALAGCGAIADKASETVLEETAGVDVDRNGDDVEISSEDGSFSMNSEDGSFDIKTEDGEFSTRSGSLPDGFPSEVPVIDGEILMGGSNTSDGVKGFTVQVQPSGDDAAASFDEAREELTGAGFTESDDASMRSEGGDGSLFATSHFSDGSYDVVLGVIGEAGDYVVSYTVTPSS